MFTEQPLTLEKIEKYSSGFTMLLNAEKVEDGEKKNLMPKKVGYKVARQAAQFETILKSYQSRKEQAVEEVQKKIEKMDQANKFASDVEKNIKHRKMLNDELESLSQVEEKVKIMSELLKEDDLKDFDFPSAAIMYIDDFIEE